jgi:hypothetical protein
MKCLVIPFGTGYGDLLRHEPLLRGIREKYGDIQISFYAPSADILKNIPYVEPINILNFRFDLIVNLDPDFDFGFLYQKRSQWGEIIGITNPGQATNQHAYDLFNLTRDFNQDLNDLYKVRESHGKNLAYWLCDICNISPQDPKIHYYPTEDELGEAFVFTQNIVKPIVIMQVKTRGRLGYPFQDKGGMKNWPIECFKEFIKVNLEYQFIVVCSEAERPEIMQLESDHCMIYAGGLRQNLALLYAADFFVGLDSVVSHVAFSMDSPSLVLYCGIFKHACYPIQSPVKHILYSKAVDNVLDITVEDVQNQFKQLLSLNTY